MMMTPTMGDTSLRVLGRKLGLHTHTPQIPPEDNVPRGCSLHSMEPLQEWFCKGADMTPPAEYEAALSQLEDDPPDIRQYNANKKGRTHFSLEGVRFPTTTVDVIQRGEALAIFERDLIIHFQQISRAAALYIREEDSRDLPKS